MSGYILDRIISVPGLVLTLLLYLKMSDYPTEVKILPGALLAVGGVLWLFMAFQAFVLKYNTSEVFKKFPAIKISLIILALFIYFFLIQKLGFYTSSWLFFLFMTTCLNQGKNKIFSWIIGTFFILFLYLIFEMLLRVPLPGGAFI